MNYSTGGEKTLQLIQSTGKVQKKKTLTLKRMNSQGPLLFSLMTVIMMKGRGERGEWGAEIQQKIYSQMFSL